MIQETSLDCYLTSSWELIMHVKQST